ADGLQAPAALEVVIDWARDLDWTCGRSVSSVCPALQIINSSARATDDASPAVLRGRAPDSQYCRFRKSDNPQALHSARSCRECSPRSLLFRYVLVISTASGSQFRIAQTRC